MQLKIHAQPRNGIVPAEGESRVEFQRQIDTHARSLADQLQVEAGFHANITPAEIEAAVDNWIETKGIKKVDGTPAEKESVPLNGKIRWHVASNFLQATIELTT